MAYSVEMPELGESVTEGTVTQWLKKVGDTVAVDEPLLEVSTDKVDTEIPSPAAGVLLEIRADEDDTVDVGAVIAVIGEAGESAPAADTTEDAGEPSGDDAPAPQTQQAPAAAAPDTAASGEATDVTMPELGESVTEGTVTQWLKKVGDTVAVDEPLLEVSTDKVDTEVPSPVAGTLVEILAGEDDTVDVGAVIARIGDASATSAPTSSPAPEKTDSTPATPTEPETEPQPETRTEAPTAADTAASGEATDVTMPELGESVTEGTVTQWLKKVGDTVAVDEPL
ncbi:MAG: pyruvate dehydrogenase complex dihydrolipoyllysine-residue acetyltransferase, partial [Corynebacterium provencense]|nr:pyruvate dehydrogenase complex dihydrolipoyllysine-residue acetyltransferase [Corynebacterium provencense]